jgi:hypothetical protein
MRASLLSILLFVLAPCLRAQPVVTFQLNLESLEKEALLSVDEEPRVYVLGSFNHWEGDRFELTRQAGASMYTGTFEMEGQAGDTLSYKFVIEKEPGRIFGEDNPDPSNPDHGNRRLVLPESELLLPEAIFHHNEYFSYPVIFEKQKLLSDFQQFRSILEKTHPALYDYTGKSVLDSLFDRNYRSIDGDMDFESFLMLMTEVISLVGCGHSSLWIPGAYWNVAPDGLFPLKLQAAGAKFYVTGTLGDVVSVPTGSEIRSINGLPFEQIAERLMELISADGKNRAFRRAKLGQHFAVKYALAYGFSESFAVQYIPPNADKPLKAKLQAVGKAEVDQGKKVRNELSLKELKQGQVALLTINSFGYYGEVPMFKSFIDSVFQVIDQKGIDQLILDLRGNGGGDPFCSSYLWGYLQPEPLPYFEDHYGRYDTLANAIPLPARHFTGKLYTLIDGLGFSTTGHFCGLLKYHRVGQFVGSETGATYTCTGNATYPALKETGIMVGTARVMRYTAAVKDMNPRRGVIPDYPVEPTPEDLQSGRDTVLEYALSLCLEH